MGSNLKWITFEGVLKNEFNATKIPENAVAVSKNFENNKNNNFICLKFPDAEIVRDEFANIIGKVLRQRKKTRLVYTTVYRIN